MVPFLFLFMTLFVDSLEFIHKMMSFIRISSPTAVMDVKSKK